MMPLVNKRRHLMGKLPFCSNETLNIMEISEIFPKISDIFFYTVSSPFCHCTDFMAITMCSKLLSKSNTAIKITLSWKRVK